MRTFHQILNNSCYTINYKNKKKETLNKYLANYQNDLYSCYYNNSSLINKYKDNEIIIPKYNKTSFNIENTNNKAINRILKTSSCFFNNKSNFYNTNNIINMNLKRNDESSFHYISPKSIEKFRIKKY